MGNERLIYTSTDVNELKARLEGTVPKELIRPDDYSFVNLYVNGQVHQARNIAEANLLPENERKSLNPMSLILAKSEGDVEKLQEKLSDNKISTCSFSRGKGVA